MPHFHSAVSFADLEPLTHVPLVPNSVRRRHHTHWPADNRFQAAARLLLSIWRQDRELPIGTARTPSGRRRKLGSRIAPAAGKTGANFLHPAIGYLAMREVSYRELRASYDVERLRTNLLSSMTLAFNVFGLLKLDRAMAARVMAELLPGMLTTVEAVLFEHSPGRGHPRFLTDGTAFDVLIRGVTPAGQRAFVAIEVKYAEDMQTPVPAFSGRCHELAHASGLFVDPDAPALRRAPLQQLFRQHCLGHAMREQNLYDVGILLVIAPRLNHLAQAAAESYCHKLRDPDSGPIPFVSITLERVIEALAAAGEPEHAQKLFRRYCDFHLVAGEIELCGGWGTPPDGPAGEPTAVKDGTAIVAASPAEAC